ncbi:MAG: alpha-N-arabinofuranosidase [Spongiibacteraceae bacterium]|nr:alpha-N-arabinofuranosidase [Spongiibacteraceae bacterium]
MMISLLTSSAGLAQHTVELNIQSEQTGATINRNIYAQFAEHLGHGIYEGIWVGEKSSIPNTKGFRNDVISALKDLQVPLVRWPGGCFADEYHWRDGIGPQEKRPIKVNTHWGGVEETNAFGTHEFFDFIELIGANAYINGNLGTGSPKEMSQWVEYMTSDKQSTLANLRRKNGREEPWRIEFFGIGNESWGCGGHMRPEYYSDLYNHYATFLKTPKEYTPKFVASGSHGADTLWTEILTKNIKRNISGISHHYYTLPTGEWEKKGAAIGFDETQWISTFAQTLKIDDFIKKNKAVLDKLDAEGKIDFYIDEWGTWYDPEPGREPGFLYQQNTLRDALVAALNLNIFHQHADRVTMTNIAQMVNVLQAMILTDKEKMLLTPTYHIFKMYTPFQDATALTHKFSKKIKYRLGKISVPALSASAAISKDGKHYLSLVNLDPHKTHTVKTKLKSKMIKVANGFLLSAGAMDSHNTFAKPQTVEPVAFTQAASKGEVLLSLPPKSVLVVSLE